MLVPAFSPTFLPAAALEELKHRMYTMEVLQEMADSLQKAEEVLETGSSRYLVLLRLLLQSLL